MNLKKINIYSRCKVKISESPKVDESDGDRTCEVQISERPKVDNSDSDSRCEVKISESEVDDSDNSVAEDTPALIEINDISLDNQDNSVLVDHSIGNDSGIAGDFPPVIDTSEDSGNELQPVTPPMKVTPPIQEKKFKTKRKHKVNHKKAEKDSNTWKTSLVRNTHLRKRNSSERVVKMLVDTGSSGDTGGSSSDTGGSKVSSDDDYDWNPDSSPDCEQQVSKAGDQSENRLGDDSASYVSSDDEDAPSEQVCKRKKVNVGSSKKTPIGKRSYDKRNACVFCAKEYAKIGRHILIVHKNEPDVAEILGLKPDEKKKRKQMLSAIRQKGNFHHNLKTLKVGGEIKVARRPSHSMDDKGASHQDYTPCLTCYVFVKKNVLWRHNKTCPKRPESPQRNRKLQHESAMLLHSTEEDMTRFHQEFISRMWNDDITSTVKQDCAILRYGSFLFSSGGHPMRPYISQKMRLLARLLKQLRIITGRDSEFITSFLNPACFDSIVEATKTLARFGFKKDAPPEMKTPSLGLKIGYALTKVASLEKGHALRSKDKSQMEDLDYFKDLMKSEWSVRISQVALNTMAENNYNKVDVLPLTEDLVKLRTFVIATMRQLTIELANCEPSIETWRKLAELTVSRIIVFNRRRSTEGSKLTIDQFQHRPKWDQGTMDEIQASLQPLERLLCKR